MASIGLQRLLKNIHLMRGNNAKLKLRYGVTS